MVALALGALRAFHLEFRDVSDLARGPRVSATRAGAAVYQCLERRIQREVPRGARVFIDTNNGEFQQRLTELAYPWADVEARAAPGVVVLRMRSPKPGCDALEVVR
jgi:hypothetical protein